MSHEELTVTITSFINEVLKSDRDACIEPVLKMFDFLKIAKEKDKLTFKEHLEANTKFKYVEKLFFLELDENNKDQNIQSFVQIILKSPSIKQSFITVKRINLLMTKINKEYKQ